MDNQMINAQLEILNAQKLLAQKNYNFQLLQIEKRITDLTAQLQEE
jgi:hypothetical protein